VEPATLENDIAEAQLFEELAGVGVDYGDVVATLEAEGVAKFVHSFTELLQLVQAKRPDTTP
jgi:transaldolase